jgi:hypothetical protein
MKMSACEVIPFSCFFFFTHSTVHSAFYGLRYFSGVLYCMGYIERYFSGVLYCMDYIENYFCSILYFIGYIKYIFLTFVLYE